MKKDSALIAITGMGSISPLGSQREDIWRSYKSGGTKITSRDSDSRFMASLELKEENLVLELLEIDPKFKELDRTALLALVAAKKALSEARCTGTGLTVNIGSSRGATSLFERHFEDFLRSRTVPARTSPTTTLGNISSWVAQESGADLSISHSATCSTALEAIANGIAWIRSGLCDRFLAGGSEAPLTDFTIAQMDALRITSLSLSPYPCRPISDSQDNTMVLGEGAALFALESINDRSSTRPLGIIDGLGWGMEKISSASSITESGEALLAAMKMAVDSSRLRPDIIALHAPGTRKGDRAELSAIQSLFGSEIPFLISNKWIIGHTLGASAALSLELAVLLLNYGEIFDFPYEVIMQGEKPSKISTVMVNSSGFGGQAFSLIVSKG